MLTQSLNGNGTRTGTDIKVMSVYKSMNYSKFKDLEGNRIKNPLHLTHLKESITEQYLISPIKVNERFEVIDGQHTLEVVQNLGLPVYYIICEGYGLSEIHRYNSNFRKWSTDDYMFGYIALGKKEYELYKGFKDRYELGHRESLGMLTGMNPGEALKQFALGKLKIKKYHEACLMADQIKKIAPFYEKWNGRGFVSAIVALLKTKVFNVDEFIDKLKFQQSKLVDCSTAKQYIEAIEDVYNFKRRGEKISFKYIAKPD